MIGWRKSCWYAFFIASRLRAPLMTKNRLHSPLQNVFDIWQGNPDKGGALILGQVIIEGQHFSFPHRDWQKSSLPPFVREAVCGFSWLRDLHALGSAEARLLARERVEQWLLEPIERVWKESPAVIGERLTLLLYYFNFYARTADIHYRRQVMARLTYEGRILAYMLPFAINTWVAFRALKGLVAAAMTLPGCAMSTNKLSRLLALEITRQILPDGCVKERSPSAQYHVLRELVEISAILRMSRCSVFEAIQGAISRLCPVLRAMCHGDGGLALFNGAKECDAAEIERALHHAGRPRLFAPSMEQGQFWRLSAGKAYLIAEGGTPPPPGFDANAHAGPLSFEFSYGRTRLITNCGSAAFGEWHDLLRQTAAHSTLCVDAQSCLEFAANKAVKVASGGVKVEREMFDGAHRIRMKHDFYRARYGFSWMRCLSLRLDGQELKGEETIEGTLSDEAILRFHLPPSVTPHHVTENAVRLASHHEAWDFHQDGGELSIEPSVYFGKEAGVTTFQIVVRPLGAAQTFVHRAKIARSLPPELLAEGSPPVNAMQRDAGELITDNQNIPSDAEPTESRRENRSLTLVWSLSRVVA